MGIEEDINKHFQQIGDNSEQDIEKQELPVGLLAELAKAQGFDWNMFNLKLADRNTSSLALVNEISEGFRRNGAEDEAYLAGWKLLNEVLVEYCNSLDLEGDILRMLVQAVVLHHIGHQEKLASTLQYARNAADRYRDDELVEKIEAAWPEEISAAKDEWPEEY